MAMRTFPLKRGLKIALNPPTDTTLGFKCHRKEWGEALSVSADCTVCMGQNMIRGQILERN
jgi:hypothetical protein